jgi:AraC-like DNA-binding protein
MEAPSQGRRLIAADEPIFADRAQLDDSSWLFSVNFAHGDLSVARYRRDRPGLGICEPNPSADMVMAVVILRPLPRHGGYCDGRAIDVPALGTGALTCLDLRHSWNLDLSQPFDSFHAYIPLSAFDDICKELKRPRIERLHCPIDVERRDETMLGLARALLPLLAKPHEASAVFTDHVFSAMVAHMAVTYGGLSKSDTQARGQLRRGMLTPLQERRVTNRLLDELKGNPGLSELASICGLSRSHFVRAFKQTTGLPPHRWLSMRRVNRAKELLQATEMPISAVALDCGFADQSHLTRMFSKFYGVGPGAWRRQRQD